MKIIYILQNSLCVLAKLCECELPFTCETCKTRKTTRAICTAHAKVPPLAKQKNSAIRKFS